MIIGMCGWAGCGKDTAADYLQNFHQFRRESFANTLKDAVSAVFGWDRTLLEGRTKEARAWREEIDPWWAERLGTPDLTPRWVLQYWGTEVCRHGFHDDIWIASLENKLRSSKDNIVISDCRFPNEIEAIRKQGGKIIWVQRGPLPDWYTDAVNMNKGPKKNMNWANSTFRIEQAKIHASETAWIGTKFDAVVDNDGSIQDLYDQLQILIKDPESDPPASKKRR